MKYLLTVVLGFMVCGNVYAGQAQGQGQGQAQGQLQGQLQGQGQGQAQGQLSVGQVDVNTEVPDERELYKGAISTSYPVGNEGPTMMTPWGGGSIQKMSEVTKLKVLIDVKQSAGVSIDDEISQLEEASAPCRFLTLGPKRLSIFGLGCWSDQRWW